MSNTYGASIITIVCRDLKCRRSDLI